MAITWNITKTHKVQKTTNLSVIRNDVQSVEWEKNVVKNFILFCLLPNKSRHFSHT